MPRSADGRWLYYVKYGTAGLFRIPVAGGQETAVLPTLPAALWGGWALAGNAVIFADSSDLKIFDLASLMTRTKRNPSSARPLTTLLYRKAQFRAATNGVGHPPCPC